MLVVMTNHKLRVFALLAGLMLAVSACTTLSRMGSAPPLQSGMVAAADPRAAHAGAEILAAGGSATDAAIATMLVLGLVEPQSAGLGGGGFLLHYTAADEAIDAYDGREWAPVGASADMFLGSNGQPIPFREAVLSGRSVGTPSLVAMLWMTHQDHGRLPWARLFEPAIRLAEEGFEVSPRLNQLIVWGSQRENRLKADPQVAAYFFDEAGEPRPVGYRLRNPAYAESLRAIAVRGPDALRTGPLAEAIVAAAQAEPLGGSLTLADLAAYQPRRLEPLCGPFRGLRVCGMGPPSSGGIAVLSILGTFEALRPEPTNGPPTLEDWSAFLWASRLAYTDRDHYVGDDQFVPVPTAGLVDPRYLRARAGALVDLNRAAGRLVAGDPSLIVGGESLFGRWGRDRTQEVPGTTHVSIVDRQGNAVALTATVESLFGSQRFAGGFFLNNQLTDFSLSPTLGGGPVPNAVAPGKRPRSSMAPTILTTPDGELWGVIGSPGGSGIIAYVSRTILGVTDFGLTMQEAIAQPILVANRPQVRVELQKLDPAQAAGLRARGWDLQPTTLEASGLHGIRVLPDGQLQGGADPRREGAVIEVTRRGVIVPQTPSPAAPSR